MTRFDLTPHEDQFVRSLLESTDLTEEDERAIAERLLDHMAPLLQETALYWVRRIASQARQGATNAA